VNRINIENTYIIFVQIIHILYFKMKQFYLIIFIFFSGINGIVKLSAQEIPIHISATDVYSFIDEIANEKLVYLNSCIKPYSRREVIDLLLKADSVRTLLSVRQQNKLDGYLFEFTGKNSKNVLKERSQWKILPPEFLYYTGNSSLIIRPLYDINFSVHKKGKPYYQSGGGAEILFHKGVISAYANLTDNYFNNEILIKPGYLISGFGGNYKFNEGGRPGGDFSEMRGGIILNWKWGHIGFVKDNVQWGDNNFGGLIFNGQNPSYPMLMLHAEPFKWLSLDYIHGWLVSEVIDSNSSYYAKPGWFRGGYQPKYIAANMFCFRPWKRLNISIGNSIVYSDVPVQFVYFIPILFYKSVDHTLSNGGIDNENSQIFLNVNSRNVKHLHLFGSLFIDEFSIRRITDPKRYNFFGYKLGGTLSNWPLKNLFFDMESTIIYPMVYKHRVPSLTFASNNYNLGYFMGANSMDFHFRIRYNPLNYLLAEIQYEYALHGNEYDNVLPIDIDRHSLIENKTWERQLLSSRLTYLPFIGFQLYIEGLYNITKGYNADGKTAEEYLNLFSPEVYHGKNMILNFGFHLGL
jgi:hypothetical protein